MNHDTAVSRNDGIYWALRDRIDRENIDPTQPRDPVRVATKTLTVWGCRRWIIAEDVCYVTFKDVS